MKSVDHLLIKESLDDLGPLRFPAPSATRRVPPLDDALSVSAADEPPPPDDQVREQGRRKPQQDGQVEEEQAGVRGGPVL